MGERMSDFLGTYWSGWYIPNMKVIDVIEIIIIAFLVYQLMVWIKNTKAWMLMKGIIVLGSFILIAAILKMNTILWIAEKSINVLATAAIVVFQPELRRVLEKIGQQDFWSSVMPFERTASVGRFQEETIDAIATACYAMSKVKTGALIVVEREIKLTEYQRTGIELDSKVSSQLLVNIFEHNTPLHDGAVIIRGDRIVAATCYLPLSDNMRLSKDLGTRHRAAVGISEVSDSLTIVVSEETGKISIALRGQIYRDVDPDFLREKLRYMQKRNQEATRIELIKRRFKNEK